MNLETTAQNLNSAMKLMSGVIERRNTIPILGTVKLAAGKIVGTNLDMEAEIALPTIGKQSGSAAIDYFGLSALASHIAADETVKVSEDDHLATVNFNGSEYQMASYPASDFPDFEKIEGPRSMIGNAGLVAAMRRVRFAVSTEETRYYLNGVAVVADPDGNPAVAATDGRRLAICPLSMVPDGATGSILPRDLVNYLCRQKSEPNAATFGAGEPQAKFEYNGLTVSAKLIDGTYPDIFSVIPKDTVAHVAVDRARLLTTLRRILSVAAGLWMGVKLSVSEDGLVLSSVSGSERKCKERMDCRLLASKPFEVGYNIKYLIEALSAFSADEVTLSGINGEIASSPAIVTAENDHLLIILMPMCF